MLNPDVPLRRWLRIVTQSRQTQDACAPLVSWNSKPSEKLICPQTWSEHVTNMRDSRGNSLVVGLLAILALATFTPLIVDARDYALGIKIGDWIKFEKIFSVSATLGNGTKLSMNTDDWIRIDVWDLVGATVTMNLTEHFNDTYQTVGRIDLDVKMVQIAEPYVVASNLSQGEQLCPQTPELIINQTLTRQYVGANRNVNTISAHYNGTSGMANWQGETNVTWDQITGIMVEMTQNYSSTSSAGGQYLALTSYKANETNLWSPTVLDVLQNNAIYIVAGISAIVAIGAAVVLARRRKPPSSQKPLDSPPSTPPTP
jgi:hypothetical protein